jgi:hypothetical protein
MFFRESFERCCDSVIEGSAHLRFETNDHCKAFEAIEYYQGLLVVDSHPVHWAQEGRKFLHRVNNDSRED